MTKEEAFEATIVFFRKEILVDGLSKEDISKGLQKFVDGKYCEGANTIIYSNIVEFVTKYIKELRVVKEQLIDIIFTNKN